ncbi:MAG TPA: translation elongation factor Ts [Candidatus Eisenbacteria bacterium]|jgi:elongation factor Ts|nr:translation elongation factor Ts [Candidatus Eisenbacteria bacterium]
MTITASLVKDLRERTGAGMMECKKALAEANGDIEKAIENLRKQGVLRAASKAGREARQGVVYSYIHPGDQLGVLLEVNCETDFVARTDDFRELVKGLAMQIAATNAQAVRREDVDATLVAKEREVLLEQSRASGKPENILQKMVEGRMEKFYEEIVLMEQPFIRDPDRKVKDLLDQAIAKIGENIVVRRFAKFRIGEN